MTIIGTPLSSTATRVLLLGSGELGKEVAIECQRLGCEVVACDRYAGAPAMQVAHRSHVLAMTDAAALRAIIDAEQPQFIIPEIEAIATQVLADIEAAGTATVVPTARAVQLTMNREGIRRLAAEELGLPTSPYRFVNSAEAAASAAAELGFPCVIKPVMSSSGKGQSVIRDAAGVAAAWRYAQEGGRTQGQTTCIVEGFVHFDAELTLLTIRAVDGVFCCPPIGHVQVDGDYRESWQPMAMADALWQRAQEVAKAVVENLGGFGLFGVELFLCGDEVLFSEVSPRPHDTGLVTLSSQVSSEFALHVRALLGLPVAPALGLRRPGASVALLGEGNGVPVFHGLDQALAVPESQIRLFGKPECQGQRRLAVALACADTVEEARRRAQAIGQALRIELG
ncbi:MAG: formate-dependent phosphoribosylglycinamide formyltransferase [Planctomycetota bacterium]|nr:MAG: formate-dependent phosphoribosylglycinamide formyltransferase [Planctomycetota bacterium]